MKTFVVVVSIWGNNGTDWVYTGNQYVMKELCPDLDIPVIEKNIELCC